MHRAGLAVYDGHGVVIGYVRGAGQLLGQGDGVFREGASHQGDPLGGRPGLASVGAAAEQDVDGAPVAAAALARSPWIRDTDGGTFLPRNSFP